MNGAVVWQPARITMGRKPVAPKMTPEEKKKAAAERRRIVKERALAAASGTTVPEVEEKKVNPHAIVREDGRVMWEPPKHRKCDDISAFFPTMQESVPDHIHPPQLFRDR